MSVKDTQCSIKTCVCERYAMFCGEMLHHDGLLAPPHSTREEQRARDIGKLAKYTLPESQRSAIVMLKAIVTALACVHVVIGQDVPEKEDMNLFVYPEQFGNFSLGSCSSAPSCGTTMVILLYCLMFSVSCFASVDNTI